MEVKSLGWVYDHLICAFSHWDICLTGLVEHEGEKLACIIDEDNRLTSEEDDPEAVTYRVVPIVWDHRCAEYLDDYRRAYIHWFYENGSRIANYDGRPLQWFTDKWQHTNPIIDQIPGRACH